MAILRMVLGLGAISLLSLFSFGRLDPCTLHGLQYPAYKQHGDIVLGGIFPIHTGFVDLGYSFRERDHHVTCYSYSSISYTWLQAMVYATEEINSNNFLLPNISLGFQLFDCCLHMHFSLWQTITALTGQDNPILNYRCNQKIPMAMIADSISLSTISLATLLGLYWYPQVSYSATVTTLSNRFLYPSFFRTIPSDDKQAFALVKLVSLMGWKWVGLLSLNNDYGIQGSQILKEELQKIGVCIAYHEIFGQGTSLSQLLMIASTIAKSSAKVVILFSRDPTINPLMELLVSRTDVERVWLASNGWSNSILLSIARYSHILMGTLGLSLHEVDMTSFNDYLLKLKPSTSLPQDIFFEIFWEKVLGCRWPNSSGSFSNETVLCTGEMNLTDFYDKTASYRYYDFRSQYLVYNAVYAVAHAIHNLIFSCGKDQASNGNRKCTSVNDVKPWQIFHHLKHVSFTNQMGEEIYFDFNGNPPTDYDILNWKRKADGSIDFVKVGYYNLHESQKDSLSINISAVSWITGGKQIPRSMCSESCRPGFRKAAKKGQPICCYDCIACSEGEISNQTDSSNCFPCSPEMWPNENKTTCTTKTLEFLSYQETLGAALTSAAVLFSITTITVLSIFIKNRNTAIVKANNSGLTYTLLGSLSLSFLCCLLFIGEPLRSTCLLQQGVFGVIFALCISCIFAKTLMVVVAFRATRPGSNMRRWLSPKVPIPCVIICTFIQLFICIYWMSSCPSFPGKDTKTKTGVIVYLCMTRSYILFWCMLGYMAFLACVSFMIAFLARGLPDSFNEAKWITFSMLIFLSVWISFVPAHISTQGKLMVAVEIFAILSSSCGILGCFFFPKCYIILFKPEMNTHQNLLIRGTKPPPKKMA